MYGLSRYDRATSFDRFMARHASTDKPAPDGSIHVIKFYNKNYYVIAKTGDTFAELSREMGISTRKLACYNERGKKDVLANGDVIYLKKKQKRAEKQFRRTPHIVRAGESMYSIAQLYGIRLKSLYKMNHLQPDYEIQVGDRLRVR